MRTQPDQTNQIKRFIYPYQKVVILYMTLKTIGILAFQVVRVIFSRNSASV